MKKIKYLLFKLNFDYQRYSAFNVRGYIGNKFKEYVLLHHHLDKNKLLYKYPLIQYKKIKNEFYILAIEDGAEILKQIWNEINDIKIRDKIIKIYEKELIFKEFDICVSDKPIEYEFITPWIALNEKNYKEYRILKLSEKNKKLQKILINNIISFCKGIDYTIMEKLETNVKLENVSCRLKGIEMTGFRGKFSVNFFLPDYIGLGKSTSRGFGTIKKLAKSK